MPSTTALDPERQRQAKAYARIRRRLLLVDILIGGVYVLGWLAFGWPAGLKASLVNLTTNDWLLVAEFGAIFGGVYFLIDLPLTYYSGFVLPHRFDLSTQTLRGWITDVVKGGLIAAVLGGLILEVVYAVLRAAPDT